MEQEKLIEKVIEILDDNLSYDGWAGILGIDQTAAEIACLFEEELGVKGLAKDGFVQVQFSCGHPTACIVSDDEGTNYCGWCVSEGAHASKITELLAQLAEMREALEWIVDGVKYGEYSYIADYAHVIRNRAKQALSAAPENALQAESKAEMPDKEGGDDEKS